MYTATHARERSYVRRHLFPDARRYWISDKTFAFNFSVLLGKRPTKLITGKFSETRIDERFERETERARILSPLHSRDRDSATSHLGLSKYRIRGFSLLDKLQNIYIYIADYFTAFSMVYKNMQYI